MEGISFIYDIIPEDANSTLRDPLIITKTLFTINEETNFDEFIEKVNNFIQSSSINKITISKLLGIFESIRPNQLQYLYKIENSISIERSPVSYINKLILKPYFGNEELLSYIKNDEIAKLQNLILKKPNFDFTWEYLLEMAANYGSVQCFKYLVLNNSPLSKIYMQRCNCRRKH